MAALYSMSWRRIRIAFVLSTEPKRFVFMRCSLIPYTYLTSRLLLAFDAENDVKKSDSIDRILVSKKADDERMDVLL